MVTPSNGNILCVTGRLWGKPPVNDGFPSQRSVTRNFDAVDAGLNNWMGKQSRRRWFETPYVTHRDVTVMWTARMLLRMPCLGGMLLWFRADSRIKPMRDVLTKQHRRSLAGRKPIISPVRFQERSHGLSDELSTLGTRAINPECSFNSVTSSISKMLRIIFSVLFLVFRVIMAIKFWIFFFASWISLGLIVINHADAQRKLHASPTEINGTTILAPYL